jgi:PadR family transcriptional regulator
VKGDYLGAFEELVLMAVQALGDAAYSASLQRTLEREARRPVSLGAVHSSLERLEAKGLLSSTIGEPTGGRGGRRRRVFTLTRDGRAALRDVRAVRERLTKTSRAIS